MLASKVKPISLRQRNAIDYHRKTLDTYKAKEAGGSCGNCANFKPRLVGGSLGLCIAKDVFRDKGRICQLHIFK
jgi:hypothetical protein